MAQERYLQENLRSIENTRERMLELLPVVSEEKKNFDLLFGNMREAETQYFGLIYERDELVSLSFVQVNQVKQGLAAVDADIKNKAQEIADFEREDPQSRIKIFKIRIRENLNKKEFNPPIWFKVMSPLLLPILKKYAGSEDPTHPDLLHLYGVKENLTNELTKVAQEADDRSKNIRENYKSKIASAETEVKRRKTEFYTYTDLLAASDLDIALSYVKVFPERLDTVANRYAEMFSSSQYELKGLESFVLTTPIFRASNLNEKIANLRFGEWFVQHRVPTEEEYRRLPDNIKEAWNRHVRQRFIEKAKI